MAAEQSQRTTAVQDRSRLTDQSVLHYLGIEDNTHNQNLVSFWLLTGKQAADAYLNHPFETYPFIPEPVEQGILAFVSEMASAYFVDVVGGLGGEDGNIMSNVSSMKVGDQSISFQSKTERNHSSFAYVNKMAGYGPAMIAGKQFWSQYRLSPIF